MQQYGMRHLPSNRCTPRESEGATPFMRQLEHVPQLREPAFQGSSNVLQQRWWGVRMPALLLKAA